MAAVVYATPGALYLAPTDATTGGTLIAGVQEQNIALQIGLETRMRRSGVGTSAGFRVRHGRIRETRLIIPLRQQDTTGLKILLSHLTTDGSTFRPTGGTSAAEFAKLPTFALVLRPTNTSQKYLYSPNWALTDESSALVVHNDQAAQLEGASLVLVATRPTNATGPAWMWDTAANINTAYGL